MILPQTLLWVEHTIQGIPIQGLSQMSSLVQDRMHIHRWVFLQQLEIMTEIALHREMREVILW